MSARLIALLFAGALAMAAEKLPAFPGAEGFGKYATGGRGGDVYHVTSLADKGPGTLREGVTTARGPRTIVFDVGGTIVLKSPLRIAGVRGLTIAGQTAPGKGITVREWPIYIFDSRDVVVRYLRVRLGDENKPKRGYDVMTVERNENIILDHLSLSWGVDGNSDYRANSSMTLQWLIYSEALNESIHEKGSHAMCTSIRDCVGNTTAHHNIYATSRNRHPTLCSGKVDKADALLDFRNCVNYNWSGPTNLGGVKMNFIGNYYRPGPMTKLSALPIQMKDNDLSKARGFMRGNVFEQMAAAFTNDNFSAVLYTNSGNYTSTTRQAWEVAGEFPVGEFAIAGQSAEQAYEACLRYAGASLVRDAVDERLIAGLRARKGKVINSQKDVGGWDAYPEVRRPAGFDTDGDGIPDEWEKAHGLDPRNAEDAKRKAPSGYTYLEEYLNSLVNCCSPRSAPGLR